ncbi:hypothetical protein SGRIM128S_05019 [Streptomyces griseomycini]
MVTSEYERRIAARFATFDGALKPGICRNQLIVARSAVDAW